MESIQLATKTQRESTSPIHFTQEKRTQQERKTFLS